MTGTNQKNFNFTGNSESVVDIDDRFQRQQTVEHKLEETEEKYSREKKGKCVLNAI